MTTDISELGSSKALSIPSVSDVMFDVPQIQRVELGCRCCIRKLSEQPPNRPLACSSPLRLPESYPTKCMLPRPPASDSDCSTSADALSDRIAPEDRDSGTATLRHNRRAAD